jgi:pimeloyl-ACP methyl ester carboxylesterase
MNLLESEMAKIDGKARLHVIPDCGHMSIWEAPLKLQRILEDIIVPGV